MDSLDVCLLDVTLTEKPIMGAYFLGIPAYTEDQLRHPTSWIEQLLDSGTFCQGTMIVGLAVPQPVSHTNKSSGEAGL